jgi:hypothetical protein
MEGMETPEELVGGIKELRSSNFWGSEERN